MLPRQTQGRAGGRDGANSDAVQLCMLAIRHVARTRLDATYFEKAVHTAACRPAITGSMLPLGSAPSNALRMMSARYERALEFCFDPAFRGACGH